MKVSTGTSSGVDPHLLAGADDDRAEIAVPHVVRRDGVDARLRERLGGMLERDAIDLAGVVQALHVVVETEDRRSRGGLVEADPLEDARAVVDDVAHDVERGVFPRDEAAVAPDLRGGPGGWSWGKV